VVTSDSRAELIDVGEAAAIDGLSEEYRRHMLPAAQASIPPDEAMLADYKAIAASLYARLLAPIEGLMEDAETLFLSPDASLCWVAFGGLAADKGPYLAESVDLHYLSASRDLLRYTNRISSQSNMLALGDPDFDASLANRPEDSEGKVSPAVARMRSPVSYCLELFRSQVGRLPNARREVVMVASAFEAITGREAVVLVDESASESNFRLLAPDAEIIHLATHGYFIDPSCDTNLARAGEAVGESVIYSSLSSGLMLAGANLPADDLESSVTSDDGYLTAYEVSSMNLQNTRLVVLSACESGMGVTTSGEGVMGLRRAFQIAGAESVISALWPISDNAAARILGRTYEAGGSGTLSAALNESAREKLSDLRRRGQPDHPVIWSPFIAIGYWGGID